MKKYLILSVCVLALGFVSRANFTVDEKVLKTFKETFPKAEQVKWEEFADNYVVNFVESGIRERVSYDREGNFLNATRYFSEEHLPVNILSKIKKRYPAQTVFGVTEVETEATIDYYIKLQDATNWITVKSDTGGNFQVVEKYKRAAEN